jgi:indole-3-glycerol phosphate synthase
MSFLDELLASTRARVEETKRKLSEEALEQRVASSPPPSGFSRALQGEGLSVIAEIKRASPLKGALNLDLDAAPLARSYAKGGAVAISVLTEPERFKGSIEDMQAAKEAGLPVLRKDFIIEPFQVLESRAAGADAVLLIARALGEEFDGLASSCSALGMDALVEVHDEIELERALGAGATLIGVNHRNLATFEVDPDRTRKLAPLVPDEVTLVALSGVSLREEMVELSDAGADAVLIGETLVTAADPVAKLRELLGT